MISEHNKNPLARLVSLFEPLIYFFYDRVSELYHQHTGIALIRPQGFRAIFALAISRVIFLSQHKIFRVRICKYDLFYPTDEFIAHFFIRQTQINSVVAFRIPIGIFFSVYIGRQYLEIRVIAYSPIIRHTRNAHTKRFFGHRRSRYFRVQGDYPDSPCGNIGNSFLVYLKKIHVTLFYIINRRREKSQSDQTAKERVYAEDNAFVVIAFYDIVAVFAIYTVSVVIFIDYVENNCLAVRFFSRNFHQATRSFRQKITQFPGGKLYSVRRISICNNFVFCFTVLNKNHFFLHDNRRRKSVGNFEIFFILRFRHCVNAFDRHGVSHRSALGNQE